MTPAQAKSKIHYHVRDADGLRPEPYGSPAAARCAMQLRGEPMPGFRVVKIGLRGACPCREAISGPSRKAQVTSEVKAAQPVNGQRASVPSCGPDSVSSDRKVQTPSSVGGRQRVDDQPLAELSGRKTSAAMRGASDKAKAPTDLLSQGKRGAKSAEKESPPSMSEGAKQAGAATTGSPICETTVANPNSAAPATTYGHAELAYLQRMSGGEYGG